MMILMNPCGKLVTMRLEEKLAFFECKEQENDGVLMPKEIYLKIFKDLGAIELRRCLLVSRRWKTMASFNILWKPLVKEHIGNICDFSKFCCLEQRRSTYLSVSFTNTLSLSTQKAINAMRELTGNNEPLYTFIGRRESLIKSPDDLLLNFKKWLKTLPASSTGIFRCEYIAAKNFFFEVFLSYGTTPDHFYYIFHGELDPAGLYKDEMESCATSELQSCGDSTKFILNFSMPIKELGPFKEIKEKMHEAFLSHVASRHSPF